MAGHFIKTALKRDQRKENSILQKIFSKEIWKVINRIPNPNMSTLQADPSALNEFFNKTAKRFVRQNATIDGLILSHIDSLTSNHDSFKLQKVTYNDVLKSFKSLRNDCSTGYDNIPVSFIKPITKYITSPLTFIINNLTAKYRVLQGSIIGPILFNVCVADMSSTTPNSNCI